MSTTLEDLNKAIENLRGMAKWDICMENPALLDRIDIATMEASIILGRIRNVIVETDVVDLIRVSKG
ncbi:MAG: hypothetical protein PHT44_04165 [Candidatus Portnoybacteria bacterium]|nr:hypothetical protein [Candidatus Portnoybacteria bacterium]MDD4983183.1 hypothetical protein [Candidatus Portnoybacteria bacterium]